jgi:hypothetical protein
MAGLNGHTRTFRLNASKRVAKFCALVVDATDTTGITGALFMKLPTGANQGPVAGITIEHWVEPNQLYAEDTDPTTITGTTPASPYASMLGGTGLQIGPTVQIDGEARCYAAGIVAAGDIVVIADAYGRVNNLANLSISAATKIYQVGIARSASAEANDVILVDLHMIVIDAP